MDIVTDNFNNISIDQLQNKLSQKFAQLRKLEQEDHVKNINSSDYYDQSSTNITSFQTDENDFQRVLNKFKHSDANIQSHEQTHASIGRTTAPISYTYQEGPDGKMYAIGGHVKLDTSIPDDPKAALFKLDQIKRASLGPSDVSGADIGIASQVNLNKMIINQKGGQYEY